jgi:hypothetical protein
MPSNHLESVNRHRLTIADDPELVFRNTDGGSPEGLHLVTVKPLGRRQELGRRIL